MKNVELSNYIRQNFKPTARSMSMRRPIFGIGVNDADYMQQPMTKNGRLTCPCYRTWKAILSRCYNKKFHEIEPTYIGVSICEEWKSFSAFRDWWIIHQVDGWHIDKDIVGGGIEYSPENCIYIPQWLNAFVMRNESRRGECLIGVHWCNRKKSYVAQCNDTNTGNRVHVGYFKEMNDAHDAYKKEKLNQAFKNKQKMDSIDERIYPKVMEMIIKSK